MQERRLISQMAGEVFFVDALALTRRAFRDKTLCTKWTNAPDILLDAWPRLQERFTARGTAREFVYDPSKRFFVLRAIARMALMPYIPIFLVEQAIGVAAHADAILLGKILAALDEADASKRPSTVRVLCYVGLVACVNIVQKQAVRLRNWRKDEHARIANAIERAILEKPLHHAALHSEHMYQYSGYHPLELTRAVFEALGHVSGIAKAATSVIMVARAMHGDRATAAWAALGTVAVHLAIRVGRLAVDWATSRQIVLQPYDPVEEICASITSIKLYAWESKYVQWAQSYCDDEDDAAVYSFAARVVRKLSTAFFNVANYTTPHLVTLVAVQSFLASQSQKSMSNSELLQIRQQLHLLADQVVALFGSAIKWQNIRDSNRIVEFCLRPQSKPTVSAQDQGTAELAVDLRGCNLTWGGDAPILRDVCLQIAHKQVVAVTGPVGQGKSSLLSAIARDMEVAHGTGYSAGRVVLVSQRGYIMSGQTVRDNITFGSKFDQQRYAAVVAACALDGDFARLENGDMTAVGDRGATVSGGQRARIVLARALYTDADTYLLDDTLAAVDPAIARHLLDCVLLGPHALLRHKTRVLVTNTEMVLPYADLVVNVADGRIETSCQSPVPFVPRPAQAAKDQKQQQQQQQQPSASPSTINQETSSTTESEQPEANDFVYYFSVCGWSVVVLAVVLAITDGFIWNEAQRLMRDILSESRHQTLGNSSARGGDSVIRYLRLDYAATALRMTLMRLETLLDTYVSKRHCAPHINAGFFRGIVHSPLAFFSTMPEPMMATAFYSSTAQMRDTLPHMLKMELLNVVSLTAALRRMWLTVPAAVLVLPAVVWGNAWLDGACLPVHRAINNANIPLSAQALHAWKAVVDGAPAIRGLGRARFFVDRLMQCADASTQYGHILISTLSFHDTLRCMVREAAKATIVAVFVIVGQTERGSAHAVDLVNSCANLVYTVELVVKVRQRMVDYSCQIRSYRRFAQLPSESANQKKHEAPSVPPAQWPDRGAIRFADYSMRYGAQMPRALDGVTLDIQPGEKIGIVGRTGAGKSSLAKALFRLVESESGSIQIDGIDISTVELHELRSRLAIIPQEPALFYGSVRDNLDPLQQHTIEDIWAAIIRAQLVDLINRKEVTELGKAVAAQELQNEKDPDSNAIQGVSTNHLSLSSIGLEREQRQQAVAGAHKCWRRIRVDSRSPVLRSGLGKWIEFEGRNFSIGQRQLVSLCRALLKSRKILVLDEATANVDPHTDRVMHAAIRSEFKDSTVITIAHRLDTVLASSDRIVVMDGGKIVQVGSPDALLAQTDEPFARLVREFRGGGGNA